MIVNGIEWSEEDIKKVEKFIEIRNRGYYVSGQELTEVYNRLLGKHVNSTQCSSCLRQRCAELETALNHARELEKREAERKAEENKAKMAAVRAAKTKKKEEE